MPRIFANENRSPPPIGVEGPNLKPAIDEPLLVEKSVRRQEELSMDVADNGLFSPAPQGHIERTIIERIVPHLVKPNAHIELSGGINRCGVLRLKVAGKCTSRHGDVADAPFDEVSCESGLREDGHIGSRLESIDLREYPAKSPKIGGIVAFPRLELNYDEMNRSIHRSEVAMPRRHNQLVCAAAFVMLLAFAVRAAAQQSGVADTEPWTIVPVPQSSLVLARDGSLIGEIGREIRTSVSIRTLPKYLPQAFVAVEDHRFYQHDGVDVVGIAGALKDNIFGERRGASTITQQLVGNMHPSLVDRSDMSLGRKLKEQAAAREMEKHYSKDQILEAYLNQIPFGHSWYGIESAARHYFGKSASKLSLAEAAALAAMPKGPALYDPLKYPDRVRQRRNVVLSLMADQGFITRAEAEAAQRTSLVTTPNGGYSAAAPWFVDVVRIQAIRAGIPVTNGGYRIYTSLDPVLQSAAVSALLEETAAAEAQPGYAHPKYSPGKHSKPSRTTDYLQGMVVALDPTSGDVRALVGGRDYSESQFDRAVDGMRQPGSSFKPIVYAAAIADSITPTTIFSDTALAIPQPNGTIYRPEDSDGQYLGPLTLRDALARSRNVVAVELGLRLGIDSIASLARRMGLESRIAPYPSSAIGASVVQPLDLIAAYTTFANLGTPVEPRFIYRVEDRNRRVLLSREIHALPPALDQRVTYVVRDMMRDVVERGTASSIRKYLPPSIPVAGKTGTTNDNTDAWFIGLTPDLVAGVWIGFDKPVPISASAAGGSLAAPVWGKMVARYYASEPQLLASHAIEQWTPPLGVIMGEFDRTTGEIATDRTPPERRYTEYFVEGTEPPPLRLDPWKVFAAGPIVF
jgi:penicillin-binding protein 2D